MKMTDKSKIELNQEDFSFVCPMKTEDMTKVEEGYFCAKCEKNVHDVSNFTEEEFEILKTSSTNLCVTFKKVAVVSLALSFAACSVSDRTGKIAQKSPCVSEGNATAHNNRLTPFKVLDKNSTFHIERSEEVNIAGELPPVPLKEKK